MSEVVLKIGGKPLLMPEINFAAIDAAWPAIQRFKSSTNLVAQGADLIEIVSHIFTQAEEPQTDMTVETIRKRLKGSELRGLIAKLPEILTAMGLVEKGEAKPAAESSDGISSER